MLANEFTTRDVQTKQRSRRHLFTTSALLFGLLTSAPSAFPQPALSSTVAVDDPVKTCPVAEEADQQELALAKQRRSPAVDRALQTESAFWKFLIDPSTSYLDRMAVAYQGGGLIPVEQLVRLWKAGAEFEVLPTGVSPSPCEFINNASIARGPDAWLMLKTRCDYHACRTKPEARKVLGYEVRLPEKAVDYPLDLKSRDGSPWLWQMERALRVLEQNVRKFYAHPDRYAQMAEVALRWRPEDFYERRIRERAVRSGPRNATWVRALVRLALEEGTGTVPAAGPVLGMSLYAFGGDSLHFEELIHVAHIAIIQQTSDWRIAAESAAQLAEMKKKQRLGAVTMPWFQWGPYGAQLPSWLSPNGR